MGFGVCADVGEAGGIGHACRLAGVGVGPALALLEFDGVIVEELIDRHGRQDESVRCAGGSVIPCRGGACPARSIAGGARKIGLQPLRKLSSFCLALL